jgi:hypothetical protein
MQNWKNQLHYRTKTSYTVQTAHRRVPKFSIIKLCKIWNRKQPELERGNQLKGTVPRKSVWDCGLKMVEWVLTKVRQLLIKFSNRSFISYNSINRVVLDFRFLGFAKCCYKPPSKFNAWLGIPLLSFMRGAYLCLTRARSACVRCRSAVFVMRF